MANFGDASLNGLLSSPLVPHCRRAGGAVRALLVLALRRASVGAPRRCCSRWRCWCWSASASWPCSTAWRRTIAQPNAVRCPTRCRIDRANTGARLGLACLDDTAGEAVENACEKTVFDAPQSDRRRGRLYGGAADAARRRACFRPQRRSRFCRSLSGLRRAIELDRFGIAAHVLAVRDGCTAERCPAFALLGDANAIKSNLKAQVFDQYVSRYAGDWDKPERKPPVAGRPPPATAPVAAGGARQGAGAEQIRVPSAASIPPVSIMNAEPPLPKAAAEARAAPTRPSRRKRSAPRRRHLRRRSRKRPLAPRRPRCLCSSIGLS